LENTLKLSEKLKFIKNTHANVTHLLTADGMLLFQKGIDSEPIEIMRLSDSRLDFVCFDRVNDFFYVIS
jgi:hypothetical protein